MDQWLKQQPLKRKQEPVQATASTESAETYTSDARGDTNDGDDNRKQRKIVINQSIKIYIAPFKIPTQRRSRPRPSGKEVFRKWWN